MEKLIKAMYELHSALHEINEFHAQQFADRCGLGTLSDHEAASTFLETLADNPEEYRGTGPDRYPTPDGAY